MTITLKNEMLSVTVNSMGAEITSIKNLSTGKEYLWQKDPSFWAGQAPILFPIVGMLKNNTYSYNDKEYIMKRHGIARLNDFEIEQKDEKSVSFVLRSSEKTKESFPFDFEFFMNYTLCDSSIEQSYKVLNKSSIRMPVGVGGHPGFNCPLNDGESMNDYYLEFEKKEDLYTILLADSSYVSDEKKLILSNDNILPLSHSLFDNDALIFHNLLSKYVSIKNRKGDNCVTVSIEGWPYLGIWSAIGEAPFVCIEPWTSTADCVNTNGDLFSKPGIISLSNSEIYDNSFTIMIQ